MAPIRASTALNRATQTQNIPERNILNTPALARTAEKVSARAAFAFFGLGFFLTLAVIGFGLITHGLGFLGALSALAVIKGLGIAAGTSYGISLASFFAQRKFEQIAARS